MKSWQWLRDVVLTGTAVFVIISQVFSRHPSDVLLATALALTAPSVADHARALLSGRGESPSSPSHHAPGAPPSHSSQPEESGEETD